MIENWLPRHFEEGLWKVLSQWIKPGGVAGGEDNANHAPIISDASNYGDINKHNRILFLENYKPHI